MVQDACTRVQQSISLATAESVDEHVILTACLYGWDYANAALHLDHPLWACLRQVDDALLSTWTRVERMVGLLCMWRIFKVRRS